MDRLTVVATWNRPERLPPLDVNPTTRTFPRRLDQAFGAHTCREIESGPLGWRVCGTTCAAILVVALVLIAAGVL